MFHILSKHRFHESIALAALFAASVTLHVAWISNLLVVRVPFFRSWFSVIPAIGPISGMYMKSLCTFLVLFVGASMYWRGKDVSHLRKHVLQFFLASIIIFFVMTLPFVYEFAIVVG